MHYMRFVTFESDGRPRPGAVSKDAVIDLSSLGYLSLLDLIEAGHEGRKKAEDLVSESPKGTAFPLKSVRLHAPIPRPRKLICVGLNYRDHAEETGSADSDHPHHFQQIRNRSDWPGRSHCAA